MAQGRKWETPGSWREAIGMPLLFTGISFNLYQPLHDLSIRRVMLENNSDEPLILLATHELFSRLERSSAQILADQRLHDALTNHFFINLLSTSSTNVFIHGIIGEQCGWFSKSTFTSFLWQKMLLPLDTPASSLDLYRTDHKRVSKHFK